jgi:ABC-2 type transport system ATP-binding protein
MRMGTPFFFLGVNRKCPRQTGRTASVIAKTGTKKKSRKISILDNFPARCLDPTMSVIEVTDLVYEYPAKRALDGVSFAVMPQTVTALVGPNGAGKTTLMRCMAALCSPYSGTVRIDGLDTVVSPREIHARLGYLPDFYGLYDDLSVRRILTFSALSHGVDRPDIPATVARAAERVGLSDRMETPAGALSRGLRQRLAIGATIVHEPKVLLLDEPASGLDPEARRDLSHLLLSLKDAGLTVVVSSHILAELEDYSSDMIIVDNGRIAGGGPVTVRKADEVRYLVRLAVPRDDFAAFLSARRELKVVEADASHAVVALSGDAAEQALFVRLLVDAGFAVAGFGEAAKALEETYFKNVGRKAP